MCVYVLCLVPNTDQSVGTPPYAFIFYCNSPTLLDVGESRDVGRDLSGKSFGILGANQLLRPRKVAAHESKGFPISWK